jgi:hypothetical protein
MNHSESRQRLKVLGNKILEGHVRFVWPLSHATVQGPQDSRDEDAHGSLRPVAKPDQFVSDLLFPAGALPERLDPKFGRLGNDGVESADRTRVFIGSGDEGSAGE